VLGLKFGTTFGLRAFTHDQVNIAMVGGLLEARSQLGCRMDGSSDEIGSGTRIVGWGIGGKTDGQLVASL
jgi:hypothetical protein